MKEREKKKKEEEEEEEEAGFFESHFFKICHLYTLPAFVTFSEGRNEFC